VPIIFGAIAIMIVLGTAGIIIYKKKKKLLGRASQIEFLLLLLAGLFMSSIGGLLIG
jgi:LPXTG-motif cell wall-anchored protein